jgi:hypothetical protein
MTLTTDFSEEHRAAMARTHWANRTLLDLCVPGTRRTSCDLLILLE